jgi:hypothetical protein
MTKRHKGHKKAGKSLDRVSAKRLSKGLDYEDSELLAATQAAFSTKKPRGRPRKIALSWVTGRAYNYGIQLRQVWPQLEGSLLAAKTAGEVQAAFENNAPAYARNFVPELAEDILALIRHRKFPKRAEGRIHFLADSLGGRPNLSLRTSRDICETERARERRKSKHHIIRHEFYVECTCGYKGPALDNACRKCGAEISFSIFEGNGPGAA